ncbi:MAG: HAMP domain-containing sensor histidine kinase [Patescibacteria group bacterium]|jgi:signal transduction histidine kinase
MFHGARLKLTAWYLLIVMLVSMAFSAVIYRGLMSEVERFAHTQELRIMRGFPNDIRVPYLLIDKDFINETRRRLILTLVFINGSIFFVSGALGYLLSGKTLEPIKEMVDEQNRFITDASHELRTPLTALKSSMEVYLRGKTPTLTEAKTLVVDSIADVNKLQSLSESLLQLTQYQNKPQGIVFKNVSVAEIVEAAKKQIKAVAAKRGLTIKDDIADISVNGNSDSLTELLVILLDNAVKYSLPDSKTIHIAAKRLDGNAEISVTDSGIGISKKDIPRIFDRFYRADAARTRSNFGGYGLGLAIAQKIVALHNGTIRVQSAEGNGSKFTITLPAAVRQYRS